MLLVLFSLGGQRYGLDAAAVEQILPALTVRAVPGTPPEVRGVFSFRNQITPVIDLGQVVLGKPSQGALSSRFIVARYMVDGTSHFLALLAELVNEVCDVPDEKLRDPGVRSPGAPFLGPVAETPSGLAQTVTLELLLPAGLRDILFSEVKTPVPTP